MILLRIICEIGSHVSSEVLYPYERTRYKFSPHSICWCLRDLLSYVVWDNVFDKKKSSGSFSSSSSSSSPGRRWDLFSDAVSEIISSSRFVTTSGPFEESRSFPGSKELLPSKVVEMTTPVIDLGEILGFQYRLVANNLVYGHGKHVFAKLVRS